MRTWLPLIATCLGTFLLLVYSTIVTVAMPDIGTALGADFGSLQWVVDVYTLALAGLLLGMGSLGDVLGRKRLYLGGLGLFALASLGCGLAGNATVLILARAVQGIAGAAMFATLVPLIGATYSGHRKGIAFAVWGAVAGAAAGLGNIAGGVLTQFFSWPWMFYGGVPLALLTLALAAAVLPAEQRSRSAIDYPGILTFTLAATGFTFGIISGGEQGWGSVRALCGFAAGTLALLVFRYTQRHSAHPMFDLGLLRKPGFNGTLLTAFGYYLAGFGALPVLSLWLEGSARLDALSTALVLAVQPAVFFATSGLLGSRLQHLAPRLSLGGGTVLVGIGALAWVFAGDGSWPSLLAGLILTGAGAGMVSPVLPATAMAAAPASRSGVASAAANCARQIGLTLGIAVLTSVFHQYGAARTTGLHAAALLAGLTGLASGALAYRLLRPRATGPSSGPRSPAGGSPTTRSASGTPPNTSGGARWSLSPRWRARSAR
ncbi:MFS transporter [Sciscionella marina]|uniref:MFS transporter n=1 Tax=Sciscionella marina TaxID=508770 RepID=UPI0003803629|nr:MFS transporter [Sciscionella marina]